MTRKLEDTVFIAFDVETASLYDFSGRMVEIGAVKFDLSGLQGKSGILKKAKLIIQKDTTTTNVSGKNTC